MYSMLKPKGFTIIELLVVMAVLAVLAGIVLFDINPERLIKQSRDTKSRTELNQMKASLQLYYNENKSYPAGAGSLKPDYMKMLPANYNYGPIGAPPSQNYEATATINYTISADDESSQRCGHGPQGIGIGGTYYICPD